MEYHLEQPVVCNENETVMDVAKKMRQELARNAIVVNAKHCPVGIISTVDMNNRVVADGKDPKTMTAKDVMSSPIDTVEDSIPLEDAYAKMLQTQRNMIVVCNHCKLKGILTIHEALRVLSVKYNKRISPQQVVAQTEVKQNGR